MRRWAEFRAAAWFLVLASSCARSDTPRAAQVAPHDGAPPLAQSSDGDAGSLEATGEGGAPAANDVSFAALMRAERWQAAEEAIARLPAAQQEAPEVRLARAKAALGRGDAAAALRSLEGLEAKAPLLAPFVLRTRAEAQAVAGPFERAGEWFAARGTAASWLRAAKAFDREGQTPRARSACDRVLADGKRTRSEEEEARLLRMRILRDKDGDSAAEGDARWLATNALEPSALSSAGEVLEGVKRPLTRAERARRVKVLAEARRTDEALKLLETVEHMPGEGPSPNEICHTRADALYQSRTRYAEAALAFQRCAQAGGAQVAEDLFMVARSYSRADRDTDALHGFARVVQRHPKTTWAEQSAFHIARIHALAGRWADAKSALDAWVKQYPAGRDRRDADRYRALAHLLTGSNASARKLLEELVGREHDADARGRWTNLAALAAFRDGDKLHAVARWAEVARTLPLSFSALVARARLAEASAEAPPIFETAPRADAATLAPPTLPSPVDLLARVGLDAEAEEALTEREPLVVAAASGRRTEALCRSYGLIDRARRRYQISRAISATALASPPRPGGDWAWECAYPRPHRSIVEAEAEAARLSPELVWAVMRQESAFSEAVVSPARAVGLLQLLPETARAVARSASLEHDDARLTSPAQNVKLGARYLRTLLDELGGVTAVAVAAYNAGPEALRRWRDHAKIDSIDVFVEAIPYLETRGYVAHVLGNRARYGYLAHGAAGVEALPLRIAP